MGNFHGDADQAVPVAVSRERIAVLGQAGGHRYPSSMPASVTTSGNGRTPSRRSSGGCSRNAP